MKFLVPNYSCLQNPVLSVLCPHCPQLNLLNTTPPPPQKKIPWYATGLGCPHIWGDHRSTCL